MKSLTMLDVIAPQAALEAAFERNEANKAYTT
ncbi:hypothetical protein QG37_04023 [Candidozyma auris]|uniref:Uncharacterized protein n=1 Tax=Candidozyma auris TaxID=498019 RepID=A0A0L0NYA0_CANAR|nr:hypothetical protein QG37_04023 [[Candida] auris]